MWFEPHRLCIGRREHHVVIRWRWLRETRTGKFDGEGNAGEGGGIALPRGEEGCVWNSVYSGVDSWRQSLYLGSRFVLFWCRFIPLCYLQLHVHTHSVFNREFLLQSFTGWMLFPIPTSSGQRMQPLRGDADFQRMHSAIRQSHLAQGNLESSSESCPMSPQGILDWGHAGVVGLPCAP